MINRSSLLISVTLRFILSWKLDLVNDGLVIARLSCAYILRLVLGMSFCPSYCLFKHRKPFLSLCSIFCVWFYNSTLAWLFLLCNHNLWYIKVYHPLRVNRSLNSSLNLSSLRRPEFRLGVTHYNVINNLLLLKRRQLYLLHSSDTFKTDFAFFVWPYRH